MNQLASGGGVAPTNKQGSMFSGSSAPAPPTTGPNYNISMGPSSGGMGMQPGSMGMGPSMGMGQSGFSAGMGMNYGGMGMRPGFGGQPMMGGGGYGGAPGPMNPMGMQPQQRRF